MTPPVSKCIFCGAPNLTREHIFSKWMHIHMPPRVPGKALGLTGISYLHREDVREIKLKGAVRDWQIKCVCGGSSDSCNNGWMRELEEEAAPLLKPMILGDPICLSVRQQETVAAWIALKAMVSEFNDGEFVTTRQRHRNRMMRTQKPPASGWGIWIGSYERREWCGQWLSSALSLVAEPKRGQDLNAPPTYYNGHSTTLVIEKLFIQVVRLPAPLFIERWHFSTPDGGDLFRIWPPRGFDLNWPPKALSDREAELISTAIQRRWKHIGRKRLTRGAHNAGN